MQTQTFLWNDSAVPEQLQLYSAMILRGTQTPDLRLTLSPSAIAYGNVTVSALDGSGQLWFVSPESGALLCCSLTGGTARDVSHLVQNERPQALFMHGDALWALTEDTVRRIPAPSLKTVSALGKNPRQKLPYYYPNGDVRVSEDVMHALEASRSFVTDSLLSAIGDVCAVCADGSGGRYIALPQGVLHFSAQPAFDCERIELYHGGRFVFGNSATVRAVAFIQGELWIQNAQGTVRVCYPRLSLFEKQAHYDRLTWELHSVRGSLCDTNYAAQDCGNDGKLEQTVRYSTNNDALWSVFHSIGDAMEYTVRRERGDEKGAAWAREKLMRVTKNVLLQSHVHGLGNGFVARGYVSRRDAVFIKDGELDTNGLWYAKNGKAADGSRCLECVDTPLARFGCSLADGRNFLLTPQVRERLHTDADRPVTDTFRLTAPICAEVPPLLAELYKKPDLYRPEKYPASRDEDLLYKADTSSEEAIAAFVQYYFVWKHLISAVKDEETEVLGELIADTAAATMTHILDNNHCLRDLHGNSTQWGKWFADYFVRWPSMEEPWRHPVYAFSDGPLNAAELLCMLKVTAYILHGNKKHQSVYTRVSAEYERAFTQAFDGKTNGAGYASLLALYRDNLRYMCQNTVGQENYTLCINYSDETLAIIAFWPLLELEENPQRRETFAKGLDEWWDNMQREGNPIYTFAYAALNPQKQVDLNGAINYLNRLPLYLRQMPVQNSERNDLIMLPGQWEESAQANILLPIDERRLHKFNGSPFIVDAEGKQGNALYDNGYLYSGNLFTWPYWTAQYYRLAPLD